ncbi:hypothetical protein OESDEN_15720, partial [Oesophagostomum dentatum]
MTAKITKDVSWSKYKRAEGRSLAPVIHEDMVSLQCAILLMTLSTVFSLKCYSQSTTNKEKPTIFMDCPGSRY